MEIQSVSGLCQGFVKSPGARISLCGFLCINSITCEHFPCHVSPQGGPSLLLLGFHVHAQSWTPSSTGWQREAEAAIGVLEFPYFISFSTARSFCFHQRSRYLWSGYFYFVLHFFIAAWSPLFALNRITMSYLPVFNHQFFGEKENKAITLQGQDHLFYKDLLDVFQRGWFYSHPLVRARGTFSGGWTGIWAPIKFGFH